MKNKEDVVMGPIILDVSHKDLYSSWENSAHTFIEDYRTNKVNYLLYIICLYKNLFT